MRFVIVSGFSGSGKSSALNLLEDEGYTCIDNLPVALLPALIDNTQEKIQNQKHHFAVGIDARNLQGDLSLVDDVITNSGLPTDDFLRVFLDTETETLVKRFSETRRRHPLSSRDLDLFQAIEKEREILAPMQQSADICVNTSKLSLHQLRSMIKTKIVGTETKGTTVIFSSFGFKYGNPIDADLMFDVRCLPNPYWDPSLRVHSGLDAPVQTFLDQAPQVQQMVDDIEDFVLKWLPAFEENNRSYLTISIGCTGGHHRSVYIVEKLGQRFQRRHKHVQCQHRQLAEKLPPL